MTERPTIEGEARVRGTVPGPLSALEQLREALHGRIGRALTPLARGLGRAGITPNQVSLAGAALNLVAAGLIVHGRPLAAGLVYLLAGGFDLMDGLLARVAKRESRFGALLDSTLDRISEGVVFAALAYVFAAAGRPADAAFVVLALLFSLLVSYIRARAEGLGLECRVGIVTLAERVVLIAVGLMTGFAAAAAYLLAALSAVTVLQRIVHTGRRLDMR